MSTALLFSFANCRIVLHHKLVFPVGTCSDISTVPLFSFAICKSTFCHQLVLSQYAPVPTASFVVQSAQSHDVCLWPDSIPQKVGGGDVQYFVMLLIVYV